MRGILKFIMTGIGLLLIGIGISAFVFSEQAFGVLQAALAQRAEDALGAKVGIESVSFSREHGGLMLEGFTVANPADFKEGDALTCEKILLQPAWNTMFSTTPVFTKITVQNLDIDLRHEAGNGSNVGALIRNIHKYLEESEDAEAGALPREIKVEQVAFNSGTLKVQSGLLPIPPIPVDINAFDIKNINEGKPVPVGKLIGVMLRDVLLEAVTLKGALKPIEGVLRDEVKQL